MVSELSNGCSNRSIALDLPRWFFWYSEVSPPASGLTVNPGLKGDCTPRPPSLCYARLLGGLRGQQAHWNLHPWEVTHLCGQPAEEMDLDQLDLNPRIIVAVKKGIFTDVWIK